MKPLQTATKTQHHKTNNDIAFSSTQAQQHDTSENRSHNIRHETHTEHQQNKNSKHTHNNSIKNTSNTEKVKHT